MLDLKALGCRIKKLRQEKGLTQGEFAEKMLVSFQAVSNWERGIAPPDLENLMRISSYFGILVDELLRSDSEDLFLGIDGGGTKTDFTVVSQNGHVLHRIVKDGCNPNDIGFSGTSAIILDGIGDILNEFPSVKYVFCGIAGISAGDHAPRLCSEIKKRYPHLCLDVKNDSANLFAMSEDAEMSVISGTGSVVFVKCGDSYKRIGGWGYLLDSAGSAYDIGRAALQEVLREEDLGTEPSALSQILYERFGVLNIWDHIGNIYKGGKAYIASLASSVFEAYSIGDRKAIKIIDDTAKALAELLNAGIKVHGARPRAIASGGIFEHYSDIIKHHIKKYTETELLITGLPPVFGACRMACILANKEPCTDFTSNFRNTYGGTKNEYSKNRNEKPCQHADG